MDIKKASKKATNHPSATYRATRWAPKSHDDIGVMGFPTAITSTMTAEQLDAYVAAFRIEEISQNLRAGNVVPSSDWKRAASPEPEYDASGRRTNTTQQRHRKQLEDERHRLVGYAMKTIPNYSSPYDYRRPTKFTEKVYVPVNDYPNVSLIGQILGPRGNSLKSMNAESGANIVIRGRGSVKEGRRSDCTGKQIHSNHDQREPLHCLITADSQQKVNKAKELLQTVISNAAHTSEWDNERKRQQMRDLATINGTFRDDEAREGTGRFIVSSGNSALQINASSGSAPTSKQTSIGMISQEEMDEEYRKLMSELKADTDTNSSYISQSATRLPPWRLKRQ